MPFAGKSIVEWMWGGFAINNATLNRFFILHFLLPFIIMVFMMLHIFFLHSKGSSNPLGFKETMDKIPFHPYYTVKDVMGFLSFFFISFIFVFFFPWVLGEPDNFIPANPLVTPLHIKPEWYFLWAYAILRSIPNKLGGVVMMFSAVLILFLPMILVKQKKKGSQYYIMSQLTFWWYISVVLILTELGGLPISPTGELAGQFFTFMFFFLFFSYMYVGCIEDKIMN